MRFLSVYHHSTLATTMLTPCPPPNVGSTRTELFLSPSELCHLYLEEPSERRGSFVLQMHALDVFCWREQEAQNCKCLQWAAFLGVENECPGDISGAPTVSATISKSILCEEHLVLRTSKFHSPMTDANPAPARDECVLTLRSGHEALHSHCPLSAPAQPTGGERIRQVLLCCVSVTGPLLSVGLWADETWNPQKRQGWSEAMWCEGLEY